MFVSVTPLDQLITTVGQYCSGLPLGTSEVPPIALPQILIPGGSTAAPTRMSSSTPFGFVEYNP